MFINYVGTRGGCVYLLKTHRRSRQLKVLALKKKEIVKNKFNTPPLTEELVTGNGCCSRQSHISLGVLGAWLLASAHVLVGAHTHVHMISTNWTLGYQ